MRSTYKRLGPYIREVVELNIDLQVELLLGVSVSKKFIPSIANTIGTDMSRYKIVRERQFAYGPVTSRNSDKVSIALLSKPDCIISTSYTVFEVIDENQLLPEYLMMWFRRPEFDRYARFRSHGSVRELFGWDEMCDVKLPIPSIKKQREIVKEYQTVVGRSRLNERLNEKLEEAAQAIYKQWFVEFEFPMTAGYAESIGKPELACQPYKSSGGEMEYNDVLGQEIPKNWRDSTLGEECSKIGSGATPRGGKDAYKSEGMSLVRSVNIHDYRFSYDQLALIDHKQANNLANVMLEEGDVLLNITGVSVARCCLLPSDVLPGYVNQHVAIVRPKRERSCYLVCLLCSTQYKQLLLGYSESGSTRQALTKGDLEQFPFLLPDDATGHSFEVMAVCLFELKRHLVRENMLLEKLNGLLLAGLATGRTR